MTLRLSRNREEEKERKKLCSLEGLYFSLGRGFGGRRKRGPFSGRERNRKKLSCTEKKKAFFKERGRKRRARALGGRGKEEKIKTCT